MMRTGLALVAPLALAAAPTAPLAAPSDDAIAAVIREEGQRAQNAFIEKDFATAVTLYERIEPLLATLPERDKELAIVRFNLARCYDELARPVEAIDAYNKALTGPLGAELTTRVRERVGILQAQALGSLTVACAVPDARVELVGHADQGPCGHRFERLAPGPYVVAITVGDRRTTHPAEITAGGAARVEPFAAAAAPSTGADRTFAWILTGSAAAALATGVAFNVLARSDAEDGDAAFAAWQLDMTPANRQRALDADDAAQTKATVSYTLLGVGGALGLAAAWVWLDSDDEQTALTPLVAPGGVGLAGRF